jgi:hypothetical protein
MFGGSGGCMTRFSCCWMAGSGSAWGGSFGRGWFISIDIICMSLGVLYNIKGK